MNNELFQKRLRYIPIEKASQPKEGYCYTNRWWCIDKVKGVIFYQPDNHPFPQCNTNESLARDICRRLFPEAEVKFLTTVFVEHLKK